MNIKLFRKGDILVIAIIIVLAFALAAMFSSGGDKLQAVITVDGEVVETVDLPCGERRVIKPNTAPQVTIIVEDSAVYFESAECKDKLCVAAGKLENSGDAAVCLPAKTVVTVIGTDSDVDAVVY